MKYKYTIITLIIFGVLPMTAVLDYMYEKMISTYIIMLGVGLGTLLSLYLTEKRTSFINEIPETTSQELEQCERKVFHNLKKDPDYYDSFLNKLMDEGIIKIAENDNEEVEN